jgi:hypothetical protein
MWEPRRLTTLCASRACYRDSFPFPFTFIPAHVIRRRAITPDKFLPMYKAVLVPSLLNTRHDGNNAMLYCNRYVDIHPITLQVPARACGIENYLTLGRMPPHNEDDRPILVTTIQKPPQIIYNGASCTAPSNSDRETTLLSHLQTPCSNRNIWKHNTANRRSPESRIFLRQIPFHGSIPTFPPILFLHWLHITLLGFVC